MPACNRWRREGLMKIAPSLFACALSIAPAFGNDLPKFQVDASWPKTLPNNWIMGQAAGVAVDAQDHFWVIQRLRTLTDDEKAATFNPPRTKCCAPAPPVMEFDQDGNLLRSWGGPGQGYDWFENEHGINLDHKGFVWVGGNGNNDGHVLKFTQDGKFVMQIGKPGPQAGSADITRLGRPADTEVDPSTNEVFIADGYGNHRVIVFDADTGQYRRHWGAYGHKPDDADQGPYNPDAPAPQQFRNPVHCAELSVDRLLYVCDRANDRVQVFKTDGTFVKEAFVNKRTLGSGSAWDIAFSRDAQQKYIYLTDGENDRVHILDRDSLQVLTTFGEGGRQPGMFYGVHSIATDSKGNIYTGETYRGQRVQRFVFKGLGPVTKEDQGVLWPKK